MTTITHTPWGIAQHIEELAEGITSVSTASHGGIKLSAERLAEMPEYMRTQGGWYEEDCEWALVAVVFPNAFKHPQHDGREAFLHAIETFRHWYPEIAVRYYGRSRPYTAEESYVVRERAKLAALGEPLPSYLRPRETAMQASPR